MFAAFAIGSAEVFGGEVAAGGTESGTSEVDGKAKVGGICSSKGCCPEVAFADMEGLVALLLKEVGEGGVGFFEALPIPVRWTEWACVVGFWIDPIGGAMASRVLAGLKGDPGRGADAHGAELIESYATSS